MAGQRPATLAAAASALSEAYAHGRPSPLEDAAFHAAYLATRLPATYAAISATLSMIPDTLGAAVRSMVDIGAGPGTATWAAASRWAQLASALQVDRSAALLAVGARLAQEGGLAGRLAITQQVGDAAAPGRAAEGSDRAGWPAVDLGVAAYTLAELTASGRAALLEAGLATARLLVLVEPGTPAGFSRLHEVRTRCLAAGHAIVAPCSHEGTCPMHATGDWCHFAVRLPRTRLHRQLKGGSLGYEDEKFACLVIAPRPAPPVVGLRVLRHPRVDTGRVGLVLCTPGEPQPTVVTRRDPRYRAARKVEWGDTWTGAATDRP